MRGEKDWRDQVAACETDACIALKTLGKLNASEKSGL